VDLYKGLENKLLGSGLTNRITASINTVQSCTFKSFYYIAMFMAKSTPRVIARRFLIQYGCEILLLQ